jgi:hypothetical protein
VDCARRDVVTCGLGDAAGALRAEIDASPYGFALVVAPAGIVLGHLRRSALDAAGDATAEDLMEPGPSTVRADVAPRALRERLEQRGLQTAVITDPGGHLLGVARRAELPVA